MTDIPQKPYIVLFNMSHKYEWDRGVVNRNFHVYKALIELGIFDKVLSVDFLPFTKKKTVKVLIKSRPWMKTKSTVYKKGNTRVDSDADHENVFHMSSVNMSKLSDVLEQLHMPADDCVFWSYNPMYSQVLKDFPEAYHVFDAVDNWIEHPAYTQFTQPLEKHYSRIKKRANMIFTVSESLVDFFEKKSNVFFVPNGVDAPHFSQATCNLKQYLPQDLQRKRFEAVIGYHGVLQSRVNFSIIDYLAQKQPKKLFVIVGPVWKDVEEQVEKLQKHSNVVFTGAVSYEKLPEVISCFDVAIIPHRVDTFTQSMNPLKLYEYMAAQKPIVSTAIAGTDQFQDLIQIAVSPEDFLEEIDKALRRDTKELQQRRKAIAESHHWKYRIFTMVDAIKSDIEKMSQEAA